MVRISALVIAAVAAAACAPPGLDPLPPELGGAVLTRSPADSVYGVSYGPGQLTVTSTTNGGNMRMIVWPGDQAASADQVGCATWRQRSEPVNQEGIALRIRREGARTRAITVTKNVYGRIYNAFNVHVWDTDAPGVYTPKGDQFWPASMAGVPLPIRMCARVTGTVVEFVVWPVTGAVPGPPDWDDPEHSHRVDVGAEWAAPGTAGWYAGHLNQGDTVRYDGLVAHAGSEP
jgi:hypothetical protein